MLNPIQWGKAHPRTGYQDSPPALVDDIRDNVYNENTTLNDVGLIQGQDRIYQPLQPPDLIDGILW